MMIHQRTEHVVLRLDRTVRSAVDADTPFRCARCSCDLDATQPDHEDPERLLGVCVACGYWYLIERSPDETSEVLLELPPSARHLAEGAACAAG